jgi:hypothetical protein
MNLFERIGIGLAIVLAASFVFVVGAWFGIIPVSRPPASLLVQLPGVGLLALATALRSRARRVSGGASVASVILLVIWAVLALREQ